MKTCGNCVNREEEECPIHCGREIYLDEKTDCNEWDNGLQYVFKWEERISKTVSVPYKEMIGADVWYQPTDSQGYVEEREGGLYIVWPDAEDTDLQTEHGLSIIKECKIF